MPNSDQIKPVNVPKPKSKNRISKRQRQRRRNKQKQALIANQIRNQTPSVSESNANQQNIAFSENTHQNGVAAWSAAYNNAVRWHAEHQNNFWRHATERLLNENQMLRDQLLSATAASIKPEMKQEQDYYETSDEDDDDAKYVLTIKKEEDDEVDSEYLEFLQVTIQHREELRLKREAADRSEEEAAEGE